jgi:hypothetical protein
MRRYFVHAVVGVDASSEDEAIELAVALAHAVNKGTGFSDNAESLTIHTDLKPESESLGEEE